MSSAGCQLWQVKLQLQLELLAKGAQGQVAMERLWRRALDRC